jgi:leucyl/phenylalanyl-tRNA--protein transferase
MKSPALPWLGPNDPFPPTPLAWGAHTPAPGLLAASEGLDVPRLEQAYTHGIFPWYSLGEPVLWWSPSPRMVLLPEAFKLHRSLRQTLKRWLREGQGEIRIDHDFQQVMRHCAETPRHGRLGSWIVPELVQAYTRWHEAGRCHSVEVWEKGRCIGGLYGVSLGRAFFGESMFSHQTDASKMALAALVCFAKENGIQLIDCQQRTAHLASLGAREFPREAFEARLKQALREPTPAQWAYHPKLWRHLLPSA